MSIAGISISLRAGVAAAAVIGAKYGSIAKALMDANTIKIENRASAEVTERHLHTLT